MWDEFEHLYNTLFSNSESYIKIVEALSSKRGGLTRAEIVEQTKLNGNGDLTAVLQFIKNNYGKDEQYWSNSTDNPARRTWEGLVFEQLCKDHVFAIKQKQESQVFFQKNLPGLLGQTKKAGGAEPRLISLSC